MVCNELKNELELYGRYKVELKNVMEQKQISRTKLSKITQIKYDIINKYYNGRCKQGDLGTITKICYVLQCKIDEILIYEPGIVRGDIDEK